MTDDQDRPNKSQTDSADVQEAQDRAGIAGEPQPIDTDTGTDADADAEDEPKEPTSPPGYGGVA